MDTATEQKIKRSSTSKALDKSVANGQIHNSEQRVKIRDPELSEQKHERLSDYSSNKSPENDQNQDLKWTTWTRIKCCLTVFSSFLFMCTLSFDIYTFGKSF